MTDAQLLSAAIKATGLTVRAFHRQHLTDAPGIRRPNIRTVWRWLEGRYELPEKVRELCQEFTRAPAKVHPGYASHVDGHEASR